LPTDLQKAVVDAGFKIEPEVHKWGAARLAQDTDTWKARGGKIVTLSQAEQQEAERRVSAAIQPVVDKSVAMKEFYNKIKAAAATVQ
jgi:TRAP-type C4-dicarboxylate transport system substrate-binding protein